MNNIFWFFDIEDDGILVAKERIEKWTYTKYPPHSRYILWKNIKLMLFSFIFMSIGVGSMFYFDTVNWTYYPTAVIVFLPLVAMIIETIKEWKHGKYWKDN